MRPLIIIGAILLFFVFLFSLRAVVTISYSDEVALSIRILFLKIKILPKKKKKIHLAQYDIKKFRKKQKKKYQKALKKYNKKQEKSALKAEEKEKDKDKEKAKIPLSENIKFIEKLVKIFFSRFAKHFQIYLAKIKINVATGDAAQTAILYGVVIQSVAYIIETLNRVTNVKKLKQSEIIVTANYLSEKTSADVCIKFALRVWHLVSILFHVAFGYFTYKPSSPESEKQIKRVKKSRKK